MDQKEKIAPDLSGVGIWYILCKKMVMLWKRLKKIPGSLKVGEGVMIYPWDLWKIDNIISLVRSW